jgi:hypothetical protein
MTNSMFAVIIIFISFPSFMIYLEEEHQVKSKTYSFEDQQNSEMMISFLDWSHGLLWMGLTPHPIFTPKFGTFRIKMFMAFFEPSKLHNFSTFNKLSYFCQNAP